MSGRLDGKVVLVTGSSRGLGKIIAGRFLEEGCRVVITSQKPEELDNAEKELSRASDQVLKVVADITSEDDAKSLIDKIVERFGQIDIVVNNAGVFKMGKVDEMSVDDFDLTMNVNFKGAFLTCKFALPHMKKRKQGQIINICSIGAKLGLENLSAYCASKGALMMFGNSLKAELKPYKIRVTNVYPHAMNTQNQDIEPDSEKRAQMIEPDDVADALIAVTSSADYVQYQDITIYPMSTRMTKEEITE